LQSRVAKQAFQVKKITEINKKDFAVAIPRSKAGISSLIDLIKNSEEFDLYVDIMLQSRVAKQAFQV